jgi:peptidyl-prolyl cis-trans isomerase A (cyclophilin A)
MPRPPTLALAAALALAVVPLAGCLEGPGQEKAAGNPLVVLDTARGPIVLEVFLDKVPLTARNFLNLTGKGFYDGTRFHRVIGPAKMPPDGFMIQGGDAFSRDLAQFSRWGNAEPNYTIPDEYPRAANGSLLLTHDRAGVLSMANRGPNTGSTQFFITLNATHWLDGKNAVFGRVVAGLSVVRDIGGVRTDNEDRPLQETQVFRATVLDARALAPPPG